MLSVITAWAITPVGGGRYSSVAKFSGGTRVDSKGYLVIKAGPQRDIRVATLILEAKLGRKLKRDEDCHHKDGNKLNIDPDNLEALGHVVHGAVSNKQRMFLRAKEAAEKKEWEKEFGVGSTNDDEDVEFDVSSL